MPEDETPKRRTRKGPADMAEKPGSPTAVRHLRPETRQSMPTEELDSGEQDAGLRAFEAGLGPIVAIPGDDPEGMAETLRMGYVYTQLAKLREQFPDDRIEKLPKPMWKNAWEGMSGAFCDECGGRHVLANCIHLDYVGHANVTDRILEIDPLWEWEPMAYTEQGLPLFTDGGMWIKLTICGVTRIGFGDGKSIKEVIGDAIRNAAMRFGVGLDLWAKVSLHEERNPGDGTTPTQRAPARNSQSAPVRHQDERVAQTDEARSNQEALDSLGSVCDDEGIPRSAIRGLYVKWQGANRRPAVDILESDSQDILDFAAHLLEQAAAEPDERPDGGSAGADGAEPAADEGGVRAGDEGPDGDGNDDVAGAGVASGEPGGGHDDVPAAEGDAEPPETSDPVDTADVEKKAGDLF